MKVLILPDSFKNCLSSFNVGTALSVGVLKAMPHAAVDIYPVADGGEGTVDAFIAAGNGKKVLCKTHDALGRETDGFYGILPDGQVVIEMAAASGIEKISNEEKNPLFTSTYGTGELILDAINNGATEIILGLGGSATNDGGVGMAKALGFRFLDRYNKEIPEGGGALDQLVQINTEYIHPKLHNITFKIAVDVQNPLTGKNGASHVYGPQKGATPKMVEQLDKNLLQLAKIIKNDLGLEVNDYPGAGAAGGMGAGSIAFLNGKLIPGFEIVTSVLELEDKVKKADIVLTGEGMIDRQTLNGKTPFSVAQLAEKYNKKVVAFAGTLGDGYQELYKHGFSSVLPITEKPVSLEESMANASTLLTNAAERVFRLLL